MIRKFLFFPLLLTLVFSTLLSACAPIQSQVTADGSATSSTLIRFLISGDPADEAAYKRLVDAFQRANHDVAVELLNIPSAGDFRKRLTADFAADSPPDLFLVNYRRYGSYVAKGVLEPASNYLAQSSQIKESDFYPQALAAFTFQDELTCLPQNISSPVIYYNKQIFDEAGVAYPNDNWTWDEFVETAKALTQDTDKDGTTNLFGFGSEASIVRMAPFVWMNGGEIVDDEAEPTKLTLDAPESREAIEWYVALQTEHKVVPDPVAEESESSESRFINGRLGMYIDSRRVVPTFRQSNQFDWDVAALPQGKSRASILHSDAFCMTAASQHKEAAWRFVEFANTPQGQTLLAETGRTVPSRKDVAETAAFLNPAAKPANSQVFLNAIPSIRNLPIMATWTDIEGILATQLQNAYRGDISVDEAIQAANEQSAEFFQ